MGLPVISLTPSSLPTCLFNSPPTTSAVPCYHPDEGSKQSINLALSVPYSFSRSSNPSDQSGPRHEQVREALPLPQGRTNAQVYVLDPGHFALDTKADEIALLVHQFMQPEK